MQKFVVQAATLPVSLEEFRLKALAWANQFSLAAYYYHHHLPYPHQGFSHILGVSNAAPLPIDQATVFESLQAQVSKDRFLCGFFAYDLKNQVERLSSNHPDYLQFPLLSFFAPQHLLEFADTKITIISYDTSPAVILSEIIACPTPAAKKVEVQLQQRVNYARYKEQVNKIKQHILEGDVYELNYCIEFYAEQVQLAPLNLYLALAEASPAPFSGYLKLNDKFLLCASPERFLKKNGNKVISQPMKGTIRRGATPEEDYVLQQTLRHNEKELAENMMIMDLVRNDLRKSCATGSVQVAEMFGIYTFSQVHQMITTVTGEVRPECQLTDVIKGAFPMGSMTGAPKIRAMEIIEELESSRRGLYSGAFGYITPELDADFNVVIRSLQYNATTGYLSFMVGSAITYDSDPEQEYAECLLKAKAILSVLQQQQPS